jgi:hypothetical protein
MELFLRVVGSALLAGFSLGAWAWGREQSLWLVTTAIATGLWCDLFQVWSSGWNFSVLEPVLLVVLLANVLLGAAVMGRPFARTVAIAIAVAGILSFALSFYLQDLDLTLERQWSALASIAPVLGAIALAASLFQFLLDTLPVVPTSVCFGSALVFALVADASFYALMSGGFTTLLTWAWLENVASKALLAIAATSPVMGIYLDRTFSRSKPMPPEFDGFPIQTKPDEP